MAEQKMYGLDERANDLWEKITRDYLAGRLTNRPPRGEGIRGGRGGEKFKVGLLTADLSAPAAFLGTPTTATAQPYKVTSVDGTPVADGDPITLRNYHPGIAGENGDYFVAVRKWGMWVVIDVDYCPPAA